MCVAVAEGEGWVCVLSQDMEDWGYLLTNKESIVQSVSCCCCGDVLGWEM